MIHNRKMCRLRLKYTLGYYVEPYLLCFCVIIWTDRASNVLSTILLYVIANPVLGMLNEKTKSKRLQKTKCEEYKRPKMLRVTFRKITSSVDT